MSDHRRHFTAEYKVERVLDIVSGRKSAAEVCREQHLKPEVLAHWKSEFLAHAAHAFHDSEHSREAEARIAELERTVGRLTLELEVAKKAARLSLGSRNGR